MSEAALLAVPTLPFLASLMSMLVSKRRRHFCGVPLVIACGMSLLLALALPTGVRLQSAWLSSGPLHLSVGLELLPLTRLAAIVVLGVGLAVTLYALGYVQRSRAAFFAMFGLFVGGMTTLVLASSFVLLFGAWELVGVGSFLLIGLLGHGSGAGPAAVRAFLTTRISDFGLLLAWLMLALARGSSDITATTQSGATAMTAALLVIGALGKSAQLPFSGWLPAAMVAPTPVSALLHSSTMVAAGVFLLLRVYPLVSAVPDVMHALALIGAVSALFGALIATAEPDLKRLLAWSTVAQLGEMMLTLGLGGPFAAALHLVAHAAFKSTLFLGAGTLQTRNGTTDMAKLGGMLRMLPLSGAAFGVAALSLAGMIPFSGYWSEEAILGRLINAGPLTALFLLVIAGLAGLYIGRAAAAVLGGREKQVQDATRPTPTMTIGSLILALFAAGLGGVLAGSGAGLIPFARVGSPVFGWRIGMLVVVVTTLALGARSAMNLARPPLGQWPLALADGLDCATTGLANSVCRLGAAMEVVEAGLDTFVRRIAAVTLAAGGLGSRTESGLETGSRNLGFAMWRLGLLSAAGEAELSHRGDRLSLDVESAGQQFRKLQTGKAPFYLLVLLIWVVAAALAATLL